MSAVSNSSTRRDVEFDADGEIAPSWRNEVTVRTGEWSRVYSADVTGVT
ncbi:hypothetical protein ABZ686_10010 [Streptomyces sp. NPDC006992]